MKQQKQYSLKEAIQKFHTTEPLKTDLASTVAGVIFSKQKKVFPVLDKCLYAFAAALIVAGIIYSCISLNQVSLLSGCLIIISIGVYFTLSFKEYFLMAKKLLSL